MGPLFQDRNFVNLISIFNRINIGSVIQNLTVKVVLKASVDLASIAHPEMCQIQVHKVDRFFFKSLKS